MIYSEGLRGLYKFPDAGNEGLPAVFQDGWRNDVYSAESSMNSLVFMDKSAEIGYSSIKSTVFMDGPLEIAVPSMIMAVFMDGSWSFCPPSTIMTSGMAGELVFAAL